MKKVIIRVVALAIVAMASTQVVSAQAFQAALFDAENGQVRVVSKEDGSAFDLVYAVSGETQVKVNIMNADSRVVYTEVLRGKSEFRRPYNLAQMPVGEYTFEVTGRLGTYTQKVDVR